MLTPEAAILQGSPKLTALAASAARGGKAQAMAAAKEFESVFLASMLNSMFKGVPTDGQFGGGSAEESWRGLLLEQYGKEISSAGGIGIADQVYRELLSLQEVSK